MPLRVLLYAVLYWEREWKAWEAADPPREPLRLTPILPIVFHTGGEPWRQNRALWDLIDAPEELLQLVTPWKPLFWDLSDRSIEELLGQDRDWLRTLAVVRAEKRGARSISARYTEVLHRLERIVRKQKLRWHDLVRFVISWGFQRRGREEQPALSELAEQSQAARTRKSRIRKMTEAATETWAEAMRREGREEGVVDTHRELLLDALAERFGKVSRRIRRKISEMQEIAALRARFLEALRAESLNDLDF